MSGPVDRGADGSRRLDGSERALAMLEAMADDEPELLATVREADSLYRRNVEADAAGDGSRAAALAEQWSAAEDAFFKTPARSLRGLYAKLLWAYVMLEHSEGCRCLDCAVQRGCLADVQRLAGELPAAAT